MTYEVAAFVGRLFVGLYFTMFGLMHFKHHKHMTEYAASKGMPAPGFSNALAGLFMLLGGLSFLLGSYMMWGALLLIVFLFVAAFKFHNFWVLPEDEKMTQMSNFMRNLGLIGFLLMTLSSSGAAMYALGSFLG